MTNVDIQERIAELQRESFERAEVDADRVIKVLSNLVDYDPRDVVEWGQEGFTIKPSSELTKEQAQLVHSFSESPSQWGWRRQLRLCDRLRAIELLGKHFQLFTEQVKVSQPVKGRIGKIVVSEQSRRDETEHPALEVAEDPGQPREAREEK